MRRRSPNKAQALLDRDTVVGLGTLVVPGYEARLHWYQRLMSEALEGMLRFTRWRGKKGGYARVVISMPPRHGKSLHGVELFPALILGRYPDMKIMVATNGAKLAKKSVNNTERYMAHAGYLKRYATRLGKVERLVSGGGKKGSKIEVENSALMMRTLKRDASNRAYVPAEGYYMAQGMGGSLTGEGFEIGIMDDLIKNAEQALNPAWHEKAWDFYLSTFATRADHPWASQLYIGTRWTSPGFVDDLVAHWRSESSEDLPLPIKEIKLPALAVEPLAEYDPREPGEGLDVEAHRPKAFYVNTQASLKSRAPWVWDALYQQAPNASGSKFLQPADWRYYGPAVRFSQQLLLVDFTIDAALSETGKSFFVINVFGYINAAARLGKESGEQFFYLDERRGHWKIEQLYAEFEYMWRKWTRALPAQFNTLKIMQGDPELYRRTRVDDDATKHHARARIWVENKALGHSFIARYTSATPGATTTLSAAELRAVAEAIYAVPKLHSKLYCYRTAGQVTAQGRVWLPQECFGEDPLNPRLPLIDAEPIGITWAKGEDGELTKVAVLPREGSWVHEMGNHPSTPDDRRDTLAQLIICRTPWLGPHLLGSR